MLSKQSYLIPRAIVTQLIEAVFFLITNPNFAIWRAYNYSQAPVKEPTTTHTSYLFPSCQKKLYEDLDVEVVLPHCVCGDQLSIETPHEESLTSGAEPSERVEFIYVIGFPVLSRLFFAETNQMPYHQGHLLQLHVRGLAYPRGLHLTGSNSTTSAPHSQ